MGLVHIMERGGSDFHEYKKAVKAAKKAIDIICEITKDMEEEYGERESYYDDKEYEERRVRRSR